MKDRIDDEMIEYVGILSKLEISGAQIERAKKDMEKMLCYIDQLKELDTSDVEPVSHVFSVHNVFREDVVTGVDLSDELLSNAPMEQDGMFVVPKTFE